VIGVLSPLFIQNNEMHDGADINSSLSAQASILLIT
jgi:hypothetical protein